MARYRRCCAFSLVLALLLFLLPWLAQALPAGMEEAFPDSPLELPSAVSSDSEYPAPAEPVSPPADYGRPLVVQLNYLKVEQARPLISALVPEEQIKTDPVRNTMVIMGSPEVYDQVNYLLAQIDTPPQQVMFEVQVLEINRDDLSNLGVDWGASFKLPAAPIIYEDLQFRIGTGKYGVNLQGVVNHLLENKKGRLLASPRIATLDGVTAKILIGDKLAVESQQPTTSSIPIISVIYVDVGIKLEVTPTVNKDGFITTRIQPEVSNKTDTTKNGNPNIRTRQADATLRVKSGVTIVLGGLIQRQETSDTFKVPILGQLPLVGGLFHSSSKQVTETELVIMLTPKIID
ncbi:type II secretion system protein D [Sporomusa termitida]|uniref:Type II secretion system protein D n=1 Tax=Sporomusa termitida TaxID=2377 RepID=A0A517DXS0_9FIRM|nr:type II secretion system protein D [Sporomusa termitida]